MDKGNRERSVADRVRAADASVLDELEVNLGRQDLGGRWVDGFELDGHDADGFVWRIIKMSLLVNINLKANPNLIRLLRPGETSSSVAMLSSMRYLSPAKSDADELRTTSAGLRQPVT